MNSAGILFTDGKNILLLRRAEGSHTDTWGLPGGHAKKDESELDTAKREAKEETGLKTVPGELLGKKSCDNEDKIFTTFIFKIKDKFPCKISKEHSSWRWFLIKDLKEQELHPGLKKSLPGYLKTIRKNSKTFQEWVESNHLVGLQ